MTLPSEDIHSHSTRVRVTPQPLPVLSSPPSSSVSCSAGPACMEVSLGPSPRPFQTAPPPHAAVIFHCLSACRGLHRWGSIYFQEICSTNRYNRKLLQKGSGPGLQVSLITIPPVHQDNQGTVGSSAVILSHRTVYKETPSFRDEIYFPSDNSLGKPILFCFSWRASTGNLDASESNVPTVPCCQKLH